MSVSMLGKKDQSPLEKDGLEYSSPIQKAEKLSLKVVRNTLETQKEV
jgi:hypothetical protein